MKGSFNPEDISKLAGSLGYSDDDLQSGLGAEVDEELSESGLDPALEEALLQIISEMIASGEYDSLLGGTDTGDALDEPSSEDDLDDDDLDDEEDVPFSPDDKGGGDSGSDEEVVYADAEDEGDWDDEEDDTLSDEGKKEKGCSKSKSKSKSKGCGKKDNTVSDETMKNIIGVLTDRKY